MHTGLLSLWVTGALLLPQCLGYMDDSEFYETQTAGDTNYTDYSFEYETDDNTTSINYDLYVTPNQGNKNGQSDSVSAEAVHDGMNPINDEASTMCRYYAVGLGLIVQRFCQ
ncbi:hypothetical protein AMELA_G00076670 [Ameiurus melas]|uniref:Uncharacterized protein n=1 Tax=Ameiurus melas TaxID=219545 RepID=A0A7J6AYD7_AMEME|nr:hypothetical protein AMELA_G00076670 [Ameiurus melas]